MKEEMKDAFKKIQNAVTEAQAKAAQAAAEPECSTEDKGVFSVLCITLIAINQEIKELADAFEEAMKDEDKK